MKNARERSGFTLLELMIFLTVISVAVAAIMPALTMQAMRKQNAELNRRLDVIEVALQAYRLKNGRLPCPAKIDEMTSDPDFGLEGAAAGNCRNSANTDLIANFTDGSNVVAGAVPTKTLGLSDIYVTDPWGGKLFYVVDVRMTGSSAFTTYRVADSSIGAIRVNDENDNSRTSSDTSGTMRYDTAILAIISYGPNGHGSYRMSNNATAVSNRKGAGSTNTHELQNCNCTAAAADDGSFNPLFVQQRTALSSASVLDRFDDVVRFYFRYSFVDSTDLS